jgi:hypothetical protein
MKTIADAIKSINPNAVFNIGMPNINSNASEATIEWLENTTPISNADIQDKLDKLKTAEANEQAQKEADALAGNNKLLELGLTQAQVTAMTGYTPPVSE